MFFLIDFRQHCGKLPKLQRLTLDDNKIANFQFKKCIEEFKNSSANFRTVKLEFNKNKFEFIDFEDVFEISQQPTNLYITMNLEEASSTCDCKMFRTRSKAILLQKQYSDIPFKWNCVSLKSRQYFNHTSLLKIEAKDLIYDNLLEAPEDQFKCRTSEDCEFFYRTDGIQVVNCSSRKLKKIPMLPSLGENCTEINLNLEQNQLQNLSGIAGNPVYNKVSKIFATHNQIEHILEDDLPENLKFLDIRFNNFTSLSKIPFKSLKKLGIKMNILDNHWTCSCEDKDIISYILTSSESLFDFELDLLQCGVENHPLPISSITEVILCGVDNGKVYWILLVSIVLVSILTLTMLFTINIIME